MGTRSLTHIYEKANNHAPLVTIYRQFDGYPSGMGADIKEALGSRKLVNGFSNPNTECNGMGCAAAMLVGALKEGECGNVYIYPPGSEGCDEEFTYRLYPDGEAFRIVIEAGFDVIYDGPLHHLDPETVGETANS